MTKNEYLIELATKLEAIKVNREELYPEIRRLVGFYQEMIEDRIEDGLSEEDAVAGMEPVEEIVARARRELQEIEIVVVGSEERPRDGAPVLKVAVPKGDGDAEDSGARTTARAEGRYTYMTKSFAAADVKRVTVVDQNRAVRVVSGGELRIEYLDGPEGHYEIDCSGGELRVRFVPENWGLRMIFGVRRPQNSMFTLTLPKVFEGDVDLRTSNGALSVEHVGVKGTMLLRTSNGRITAEQVSGATVKFVTSNGGIRLNHVSADALTAQTSNGKLESEHVAAAEVALTTSNGANEARRVGAKVLRIETCNGHLSIERVKGDDITLTSSNGAISGTVLGEMADYAITSRTSNAKSNLPAASAGPKKLNARTSNAKIDITFEK